MSIWYIRVFSSCDLWDAGDNGTHVAVVPKSNLCITGLYIYDNRVVEIAKKLKPSKRAETEIVDLHNWYLEKKELEVAEVKGKWIDAGTFDSLLEAQNLAKEKLDKNMII